MTDTAIEERDEQVAQAISAGRSLRLVRKQFSLSEAELDAILETLWPLSTDARIRMVKHDLARLERVIETLFEKSIAGDVNASVAFIRALERRAALVGLDSARTIDLTITPSAAEPSGYAKITAALLSLKYDRANGGNGALGEAPETDPDATQP